MSDTLPSFLRDFISFAYKTGWRFSEISDLTWSQVDLFRMLSGLRLVKQKTMKAGPFTWMMNSRRCSGLKKSEEKSTEATILPRVSNSYKFSDSSRFPTKKELANVS